MNLRTRSQTTRTFANERVYTREGMRCPCQFQPHDSRRAYNICVADVQRQNDSSHKHERHAIYATETSGLLLVAFLLLALTLVRYWHVIHWSVR